MKYSIRDLETDDIYFCEQIVSYHWGDEIAQKAKHEMWEMFLSRSRWPPHYIVAVDDDGCILGFAGFRAALIMSNVHELIWINIGHWVQSQGIGRALTEHRIAEIARRGGTMVLLMTQKKIFFEKMGFVWVANIDGWELMFRQLAPLTISGQQ